LRDAFSVASSTLILRLRFRQRLLGILHCKVELIGIELFGFASKLGALKLAQRLPKTRIGILRTGQLLARFKHQFLEQLDVVGQRFGVRNHGKREP
jgi:hypothetical protein